MEGVPVAGLDQPAGVEQQSLAGAHRLGLHLRADAEAEQWA